LELAEHKNIVQEYKKFFAAQDEDKSGGRSSPMLLKIWRLRSRRKLLLRITSLPLVVLLTSSPKIDSR
jgi:hypothetical protein